MGNLGKNKVQISRTKDLYYTTKTHENWHRELSYVFTGRGRLFVGGRQNLLGWLKGAVVYYQDVGEGVHKNSHFFSG